MKIESAAISMQSSHALSVREESHESLRAWVGSRRPDFEGRGPGRVEISDAGKAAQAAEAATKAGEDDPRLLLVKRMIEMLTGRSVRLFDAASLRRQDDEAHSAVARAAAPDGAGFGIEYDYHAVRAESEQTRFAAEGVVRTADGQEIRFHLELAMTREFREEVNVSLRAGDAQRKDPLVINFDGTAAQLTDQHFRFDLDADGQAEEIALLGGGSGYLALDANGNGRIDSGAELFGPRTDSGFTELAALDGDGNGWIDENDVAYERLRIWTPAAEGPGSLATLQERQVGALFTGQLATPFELRGQGNTDLGAVRATGLYLTESGSAGSLQEIDLTV